MISLLKHCRVQPEFMSVANKSKIPNCLTAIFGCTRDNKCIYSPLVCTKIPNFYYLCRLETIIH